jgi:hypothetical protein
VRSPKRPPLIPGQRNVLSRTTTPIELFTVVQHGSLDPLAEFLAGQSNTLELARDLVFTDQSLIRGINGLALAYLGRSFDQDLPVLELFFQVYRSAGDPLLLSTILLASQEYLNRVEQGLV